MTNKEVANLLHISPATLSLVVNNKPGISDATREKVLEGLSELNLLSLVKTQTHAVSLQSKAAVQERNLAFIAYKRHGEILDRSPFYMLLMESVQMHANKNNYNLLFTTVDKRQPLAPQIQYLSSMNTMGAVVFATEMLEDDLDAFRDLLFPCVYLDNQFSWENLDCVSINNALGTYQAIHHLVSAGHRKIGHLKSATFIQSFGERREGFEKALNHFGLSYDPKYTFELDYSEEGSYQDFRRLLNGIGPKMPTAFVTDDDTIAVGAMKALIEAGYSIPQDISIVGYNDRPLCEISSPPLTSINVPKYTFGAAAIDLLIYRINENENRARGVSFKYKVDTLLVPRSSVASCSEA